MDRFGFCEARTDTRASDEAQYSVARTGLSLLYTISKLDNLDVKRSRKTVHDWAQKADLQQVRGCEFSDEQNSPSVAVFSTNAALTEIFLKELRQRHDVETVVFLVDDAKHLQTALQQ